MKTFLFWNIRRRPLEGLITHVVESQLVDIVMLAECSDELEVLRSLNQKKTEFFSVPTNARVSIFARFGARYFKKEAETHYYTIRRLTLLSEEIILVVAHLPSKTECEDADQDHECIMFVREIVEIEKKRGNHKTIVVGDLNMNPFQDGIVSAAGLHGVMTKGIARKQTRVVKERLYEFFYNPMWKFVGGGRPALPNGTDSPSGTCYYWRSDMIAYFWNVYDQVLTRLRLRPTSHVLGEYKRLRLSL